MTGLDELIAEVKADPESIGLILHGSRSLGTHGPDSGVDLVRVVADESYAGQRAAEQRWPPDHDQLRVPLLELELLDSRGVAHQWGPEDGLDAVKEHRFE